MTVTQREAGESLPTNIDTLTPLTNPSHSSLHNMVNRAANALTDRVSALEQVIVGLTMPGGTIDQARLAAHQWTAPGQLVADGTLLMPLMWNLTERTVTFQAAKATVLVPADQDIAVDIVVGVALAQPVYDETTQTSILAAGKLVIPAGEYTSPSVGVSGFVGQHPVNSYVVAYLQSVGTEQAPGATLVVQLNRNL